MKKVVRTVTATSALAVPQTSRFCVEISTRLYRICWLGILGLHVCCSVYLLQLARLYWYLAHPYLSYYANLASPGSAPYFKTAGVLFGILGGCHAGCAGELLALSCWAKRLVLSSDDVDFDWTVAVSNSVRRASMPIPVSVLKISTTSSILARLLASWWGRWFSRTGVFGIESSCFDLLFLLRELLEVVLQTYQAHQTSEMIATMSINRLFVSLVVVNCWTTPLVQYSFRRNPPLGRLCGTVVDIALNIATNMVIPLVVFLPYLRAWIPESYTFETRLLYDDRWFPAMILETRVLFAGEVVDFVVKFVPHVSILLCLGWVKTLTTRASRPVTRVVSVAPATVINAAPSVHPLPVSKPSQFRLNGWKTRVTHAMLASWGVVLLGLHIAASTHGTAPLAGCKESVRSWFSCKSTCITFEYNCYRRQATQSLVEALAAIQPTALRSLTISHCAELVVPAQLRGFPNLVTLELFNVSLREWSVDAAISHELHPHLAVLLLIFVNMTQLPDGVLVPLPDRLRDIEIAYSNLTHLPDNLHTIWHALDVLYYEFSQVDAFPLALLQLQVDDLSLIGNRLETVPQLSAFPFQIYMLALSHNPLHELPFKIRNDARFGFLAVEHTQLTTLPPWALDVTIVEKRLSALGSPLCEANNATTTTRALCGDEQPRGDGRYPLSITRPQRIP